MKKRKKFLSMILSLSIMATLVTILPVSVNAATVSGVTYSESTELESGTYMYCKIIGSQDPENPVVITVKTTADVDSLTILEGYVHITGGTISQNSTTYTLINVKEGAHLTLSDIIIKGTLDSNSTESMIMLNGGTLDIKDGTELTGGNSRNGGAIYCYSNSKLNMYGGKIYNNSASVAGGAISGAGYEFNMYGGEIYGNTATEGYTAIGAGSSGVTNLSGGLILGTLDSRVNFGTEENPMYKGTIEGLPTGRAAIADGDISVLNAKNGDDFYANKEHRIIANDIQGVYSDGIWNFSVIAPTFTTTPDAGYYSEARDSEPTEGTIAFNSIFSNLEDCNYATGYGMYIYGNSSNRVQLTGGTIEELKAEAGKFYATVNGIPADKFGSVFTAMPFVFKDTNIITGDTCTFSVNQGSKWLGTKSE